MSSPKKLYLTIAGLVTFMFAFYLVVKGAESIVAWVPTVNWVPVAVAAIACIMLCFALDTTYTYFFTDAARPVEAVCFKWLGYCTRVLTNVRALVNMGILILIFFVSVSFVFGVARQVQDFTAMSYKARSFDRAMENVKQAIGDEYKADLQEAAAKIAAMSKDIAEKDALIEEQKAIIEQLREDNKALQKAAKVSLSSGARGNP
jgi:hypothetical protein